jgi:hypothetical protein
MNIQTTTDKLASLAKALGMKGTARKQQQPRATVAGKGAATEFAQRRAPSPSKPINPREEARQKALETDRKLMKRYQENRLLRFHKLIEQVPNVQKYCAMLDKCGKLDVFEVYSANDCNLDIVELIERYDLRLLLESESDRFYIFEITRDWLTRMAKVQDKLSDDVDPNDFFKQPAPTALSEAKLALGVT